MNTDRDNRQSGPMQDTTETRASYVLLDTNAWISKQLLRKLSVSTRAALPQDSPFPRSLEAGHRLDAVGCWTGEHIP